MAERKNMPVRHDFYDFHDHHDFHDWQDRDQGSSAPELAAKVIYWTLDISFISTSAT